MWPSTLALSVYNAVNLTKRDMTVPEIVTFLSAVWEPSYTADNVNIGVAFLKERELIEYEPGGFVKPLERDDRGYARQLVRADRDRELVLGSKFGAD